MTKALLLTLLLCLGTGHIFAQSEPAIPESFEVHVDGQRVEEKSEYTFNRDETYELKVQGLKPYSVIYLRYKKAGIKAQEQQINVPGDGRIKKLLEAPDAAVGLTCELDLVMANGEKKAVSFRLKFRNLDKKKKE